MATKKPVSHTGEKKYPQRKVPGTDKSIDRARPAKPVGWRISDKTGRRYFEDRENRSDTEKERRYHGGVNRRAEPGKRTAKPSTRTTRSTTTARRVSQVGKRDTQKDRKSALRKAKDLLKIVKIKKSTSSRGRSGPTIKIPAFPEGLPEYVTVRNRRVKVRYGNLITPAEEWNYKKLSAADLLAVAKEYGKKIHDATFEHGILLDECGNCIGHILGKSTSVMYPGAIYKKAVVILHNHPDQGVRDYYTPHSGTDVANLFLPVTPKHHMVVTHGRWYNWTISSPGTPIVPSRRGAPHSIREISNAVSEIHDKAQQNLIERFCASHYIGCKFSSTGSITSWIRLYSDMPHTLFEKAHDRVFRMYLQNRWQVMVVAEEKEIREYLNKVGERRFKFMKGDL